MRIEEQELRSCSNIEAITIHELIVVEMKNGIDTVPTVEQVRARINYELKRK